MKKMGKFLGFIAFAAMIGFFMVSCEGGRYWHGGIFFSQSGTYTFPSAAVGYGPQTPLSVTARNYSVNGVRARIELSGTGASAFAHSSFGGVMAQIGFYLAGTSDEQNRSRTHTFTVWPRTGLAVGTYEATVTVYEITTNTHRDSFQVRFTVY